MASMPWVKIYTEMLDDPKMSDLEPEQKWLFVQLILIAGECDQNGIIPILPNKIAWRLREDATSVSLNINALKEAGLIDFIGDSILVVSFAKRQERSQAVKRQQWNDAQRRHRMTKNNVIDESSMTHSDVILVEESREDKIRVEESRERAGDDFAIMQALVESKTGYLINQADIPAINRFIECGVVESDIDAAIAFFADNKKVARGAANLEKSVMYALGERIQKNGKKPKPAQVWTEEH